MFAVLDMILEHLTIAFIIDESLINLLSEKSGKKSEKCLPPVSRARIACFAQPAV